MWEVRLLVWREKYKQMLADGNSILLRQLKRTSE